MHEIIDLRDGVAPTRRWLTVADVRDEVGMPVDLVKEAIRVRDLEAVTTHPDRPGQWMVGRDELTRWLSDR